MDKQLIDIWNHSWKVAKAEEDDNDDRDSGQFSVMPSPLFKQYQSVIFFSETTNATGVSEQGRLKKKTTTFNVYQLFKCSPFISWVLYLLYILTSIWVLHTPNADRNTYFWVQYSLLYVKTCF